MTTTEFNVEYDQLRAVLSRFALSLTHDVEDAKDLVQETIYRAYWNRSRFSSGTNFKAWMMTIMRNTYISAYRKKRRSVVAATRDDFDFINYRAHAVENTAEGSLSLKELQGLLKKLNPIYSLPFTLFYTGYRYEEISQQMNLPIGTVKSRIFFARKKLRAQITSLQN